MAAWLRAICLALALGLFTGGPAEAKWLRAETQRFVIYSNGSELALRDYAEMLEDFDIVLRFYHGVDQREAPLRKLDIYLVRDNPELLRATTMKGDAIAGFYEAGEDDIFAAAIRDRRTNTRGPATGSRIGGRGDRSDVLFHEYTHHFMSQYATFPYPAWMSEGLAEYFGPTEIEPARITVGGFSEGRAWQLGQDWMPLDELLAGKRGPKQWSQFYAQSWLLTHYMVSDPTRRAQLETYKRLVSEGADPVQAMQSATGMDVPTLTKALRGYMLGALRTMVHARKKLADLPITITELGPSADDLLLENQKLMNGLGEEEQKALLAAIRARAAKYPGDQLAVTTLARAEILYGDRTAGEQSLKAWLTAHPNDTEALRLMAKARILTAEELDDADEIVKALASARPYLVKANELEPDNYQTYYYFARSRRFDRDYPSDNTMELLKLANRIAPQVEQITFQTAQAMVLRKEFDEARPMLLSLANDPHGGGAADAARQLLNQIASYTSADAN